MNILIVIGTRPNFIKVTQFKKVIDQHYPHINLKIVHTGQHYDEKMANIFFDQFELRPDYFLNISPDTPIKQMADIMGLLEELVKNTFNPDLMIVPGDVNSTLAAALVANKNGIKLAHLESGLRSLDRTMPEEWNRILVDEMADYYFVTEKSGIEYLNQENKKGKIFFVGNTMIDTMVGFEKQIQSSDILVRLNINIDFVLLTLHRPSNVDSKEGIKTMISLLSYLNKKTKVVFPIHPRTRARITSFGYDEEFSKLENIILTEPLGYFDFQKLIATSKMVLTDSGGIQEETTFRGIPCLTLRENTERPITIDEGTNTLVPFEFDALQKYIDQILEGTYKTGKIPELWDGKATERILKHITEI
ncbi:UDP-N-acetylglucosamine 2-epimerase (non-hydrolysing) [Gelidibacter algens]|uniref:UDP-N-acetylglucosamine 2-epimerase (Non-hydrolysing) n=1 Tax=Gelidibacter algens TaxID=49280 RepID=A0A1A7R126_9FLAO|nr:UDP-N-acetylglucosamine 2-epimerase (non-hydrolyzing) [Gelidibacter algens]OBX25526.1 UDP-N-acetylglucosamine 2-epimerase [Gelidibacter algens]RAJ22254.1 UDP-N-acetylglucosamine 2-epimerase (non-hydrolysing) [Gelidibacter algens]